MIPNTHPTTGIAYGVVSMNKLDPELWESLIYRGENLTCKALFEQHVMAYDPEEHPDRDAYLDEFDANYQGFDEEKWAGETSQGIKWELGWLGGAPLLWILESPHVGDYEQCSPCVPNAGNLEKAGNLKTYTIPNDWWYDET